MIGKDPRPGEAAIRLTRETHAILLPALREIARQRGYAIAVHGSLERDIDLLAVPWTDTPTAPESLVLAIFCACEAIMGATWSGGWTPGGTIPPTSGSLRNPERRPHGRLGWVIMLPGTYIDLSVMPPTTPQPTSKGSRR